MCVCVCDYHVINILCHIKHRILPNSIWPCYLTWLMAHTGPHTGDSFSLQNKSKRQQAERDIIRLISTVKFEFNYCLLNLKKNINDQSRCRHYNNLRRHTIKNVILFRKEKLHAILLPSKLPFSTNHYLP